MIKVCHDSVDGLREYIHKKREKLLVCTIDDLHEEYSFGMRWIYRRDSINGSQFFICSAPAGENVNMEEIVEPHCVSGCLKLFLRELTDPVCTFELYDCFLAAACMFSPFSLKIFTLDPTFDLFSFYLKFFY